LAGEEIDLVGRQIESGQPSDVFDVVSGDAFRHADEDTQLKRRRCGRLSCRS
jgi:hypothetical protein